MLRLVSTTSNNCNSRSFRNGRLSLLNQNLNYVKYYANEKKCLVIYRSESHDGLRRAGTTDY